MAAYEVSVSASFRARHSVALPDGTMEPAHEHDWQVVAVFRAPGLNDDGFVVDFLAVREALAAVTGELAGADLNQALGAHASAERLAEHLAAGLAAAMQRELHCLRVREGPGCWAAFYPGAAGPRG